MTSTLDSTWAIIMLLLLGACAEKPIAIEAPEGSEHSDNSIIVTKKWIKDYPVSQTDSSDLQETLNAGEDSSFCTVTSRYSHKDFSDSLIRLYINNEIQKSLIETAQNSLRNSIFFIEEVKDYRYAPQTNKVELIFVRATIYESLKDGIHFREYIFGNHNLKDLYYYEASNDTLYANSLYIDSLDRAHFLPAFKSKFNNEVDFPKWIVNNGFLSKK